jgi:hypothetical protein
MAAIDIVGTPVGSAGKGPHSERDAHKTKLDPEGGLNANTERVKLATNGTRYIPDLISNFDTANYVLAKTILSATCLLWTAWWSRN